MSRIRTKTVVVKRVPVSPHFHAAPLSSKTSPCDAEQPGRWSGLGNGRWWGHARSWRQWTQKKCGEEEPLVTHSSCQSISTLGVRKSCTAQQLPRTASGTQRLQFVKVTLCCSLETGMSQTGKQKSTPHFFSHPLSTPLCRHGSVQMTCPITSQNCISVPRMSRQWQQSDISDCRTETP